MDIENIQVFTQSSIRIEGKEGIIYIDPFEIKGEAHDADYILFTHDHYDHFSPEDIKKVCKGDTIYVYPKTLEKAVKGKLADADRAYMVEPGESKEIKGLVIKTVPAYNNLKPFHPRKKGWVGYILTVDDREIYVAGDTDMTKDNQRIKCDIALVPIGGRFTMNPKEAAELVNIIKPNVVIPTHYGSIVGSESDGETFARLVDDSIEVRLLKQYP